MRVFDLHCDTVTACLGRGEGLAANGGHISLEKWAAARAAGLKAWAQAFAIFVPDGAPDPAASFDRALAFYDEEAARCGLAQYCQPLLAMENGVSLDGDPARVDALADRGIQIMGVTWNGANGLGCGSACDPACGLTAAGCHCVRRMFERGVAVDVSHLNEAGFSDVLRLQRNAAACGVRARVIATHSNCAAMQPHPRNLTDDQLRALFAAGGLVGVNLYPPFLGGEGTAEEAARHIRHILTLGGAAYLALGTDFDGCTVHPSLAGLDRLPGLRRDLAEMGVPPAALDGMFWDNAAAFFQS
ncbi:MAG: membrane dipeptidase [Oscillospiraceae bacterium]|jgi:membrane dipeptidase|nr:membrane dipeptidase [Oscillospiraceae bacterium]